MVPLRDEQKLILLNNPVTVLPAVLLPFIEGRQRFVYDRAARYLATANELLTLVSGE